MRDCNTAGPVRPDWHHCIPPLDRLNLREVPALVRRARYFVLHAPRQTGKTSALLALRDLLNGGSVGDYRCAYVNVEPARTGVGHLVVFDMREGRSWEQRVFREERTHDGRRITVWGA